MKNTKRLQYSFFLTLSLSFFSCKSLDPFASPDLVSAPQAYSRVNFPLEIPFETLTNLANQRIPPVLFSEEKMDMGNGIQGDLQFSRNGLVEINGVDAERLELTFPIHLEGELGLKPGGLRNLFQNKVPISQDFNPKILVNPEVYPNWSLGVSEFNLLDLGGDISLNVLGFQLELNSLIQREIKDFATKNLVGKRDLIPVKPMVDQAWNQVGKPIYVDFFGKEMAFSIQPDSVKISEKINPGSGYQFNLGLAGKVNAHPADAAPSRAFPLPTLTPNTSEVNELEIRIPLFISYAEIDEILNGYFENQLIRINKTTVFTSRNFKTQAYGEKLGIWMDFTAIQENKDPIEGRLFLVGLPSFELEENAMAFREVDFYLESESKKAKTAAALKKRKIIRQLDKKLRFPLGDTFESGIAGIQERLSLETPVANLSVVNLQIDQEGFYPGKLGLVSHILAKGKMEVRWK
ncbi:uncharacterized protein DUF4403 [Algoriphagus boseongensis]|uniref:Uncharacterized protein DUF4403 n=1 Tax=Algoriphagus boseongensis TaxID=1442587 RepID=A0A4R6T7W0_9BACT|nr:DUF4403 family protein [Algoriphagus boseongensis]TDQ17335.1 uncharacterized protein DUF4403 [Algoriphagus boseongensis]